MYNNDKFQICVEMQKSIRKHQHHTKYTCYVFKEWTLLSVFRPDKILKILQMPLSYMFYEAVELNCQQMWSKYCTQMHHQYFHGQLCLVTRCLDSVPHFLQSDILIKLLLTFLLGCIPLNFRIKSKSLKMYHVKKFKLLGLGRPLSG